MTVMATPTPVRVRADESRPLARTSAKPERITRRLRMVAACYAGIVMLVAMALVASRVWPSGVVAPLFMVGMLVLVALLHPRASVTRRIR